MVYIQSMVRAIVIFFVVEGLCLHEGKAVKADHVVATSKHCSLGRYHGKTADELFFTLAKFQDYRAMARFFKDALIDVDYGSSSYSRYCSLSTVPLVMISEIEDEGAALCAMNFLLRHHACVDMRDEKRYITPLHAAARRGRTRLFRELLAAGADIKSLTCGELTLLHTAASCCCRNEEILDMCLRYGFDVDVRDGFGQTPLMFAILSKNHENVLFLLQHGANPSAMGGSLGTPLHYAVYACAEGIVNVLLSWGGDFYLSDGDVLKSTPLQLPQSRGLHGIVQCFLACKI